MKTAPVQPEVQQRRARSPRAGAREMQAELSSGAPAVDCIEPLTAMGVDALRAAWRRQIATEPPCLRTRELLALALAYRLQAKLYGDVSGGAKRKLSEYQRRFRRDREYSPTPGPTLKPGSSVIKAYRGVRHEVIVLEQGFAYRGKRFGSLSEVATHITGTKWNGNVFFGLKERTR